MYIVPTLVTKIPVKGLEVKACLFFSEARSYENVSKYVSLR